MDPIQALSLMLEWSGSNRSKRERHEIKLPKAVLVSYLNRRLTVIVGLYTARPVSKSLVGPRRIDFTLIKTRHGKWNPLKMQMRDKGKFGMPGVAAPGQAKVVVTKESDK